MDANSAMPEGIKRETITNELLRRLANVSQNHPTTRANTVVAVNEYMHSMKISGYSEKTRRGTCLAAFKGFEKKVQESIDEGKPLHRHRKDGEGERFNNKVALKSRWFKKKKKPMNTTKNQPKTFSKASKAKVNKPRRKPAKILPNKQQHQQDDREIDNVILSPTPKVVS